MSHPTPKQLQHWLEHLNAIDYDELVHRLAIAINRDQHGGSNEPDGYPSSTRGGGGTAELTSTEAAAAARLGDHVDGHWHGLTIRDEHAHLTEQAVGYLSDAIRALDACHHTLAKMEAASIPLDLEDDRWCRSCLRDGGYKEPVSPPRYATLCRWCGDFQGKHGFDPPMDLLRPRHEHRPVTIAMVDAALARRAS